jgi:hypothetical protein
MTKDSRESHLGVWDCLLPLSQFATAFISMKFLNEHRLDRVGDRRH